ncbi:MAG: DUF1801 domain-containing protein [Bacteroidetes bacterium]|nr:DUF1801 domain-containing protein [Bacteroidota bacterium]
MNADQYLEALSAERRPAVRRLYQTITENLPEGFAEGMAYGMICWSVPHSLFPAGYHCDPRQPLPFLQLASQKSHIALYHMGLYAGGELLEWFQTAWKEHSARKLDMGKSCIRFKKPEEIPFELIGELCRRVTPAQWIEMYQTTLAESQSRKAGAKVVGK